MTAHPWNPGPARWAQSVIDVARRQHESRAFNQVVAISRQTAQTASDARMAARKTPRTPSESLSLPQDRVEVLFEVSFERGLTTDRIVAENHTVAANVEGQFFAALRE